MAPGSWFDRRGLLFFPIRAVCGCFDSRTRIWILEVSEEACTQRSTRPSPTAKQWARLRSYKMRSPLPPLHSSSYLSSNQHTISGLPKTFRSGCLFCLCRRRWIIYPVVRLKNTWPHQTHCLRLHLAATDRPGRAVRTGHASQTGTHPPPPSFLPSFLPPQCPKGKKKVLVHFHFRLQIDELLHAILSSMSA